MALFRSIRAMKWTFYSSFIKKYHFQSPWALMMVMPPRTTFHWIFSMYIFDLFQLMLTKKPNLAFACILCLWSSSMPLTIQQFIHRIAHKFKIEDILKYSWQIGDGVLCCLLLTNYKNTLISVNSPWTIFVFVSGRFVTVQIMPSIQN